VITSVRRSLAMSVVLLGGCKPPASAVPSPAEASSEIEISILNRQCMGRRRFESLAVLDPQVRQWNRRVNRERLRFRWGFTAKKARTTFKYAPRADQDQAA
jgi:hypothetical protein